MYPLIKKNSERETETKNYYILIQIFLFLFTVNINKQIELNNYLSYEKKIIRLFEQSVSWFIWIIKVVRTQSTNKTKL